MSNGVKISALLLLAVVCGGGFFVGTALLESRQKQEDARLKQTELNLAKEKRLAADAAVKEKAAAAKKADAEKEKAKAEKEKATADLDAKRQEAENLRARQQTARLEAEAKDMATAAAKAETKRLEAEKAKADASRKEQETRRAAEELTLKRVEEERRKAEAEATRVLAAKAVADAALKKSENERKTAEANAAAEHDRKLRMYRRAESSRAEMLELQRAERALALEEAGLAPETALTATASPAPAEPGAEETAQTNAVVNVTWPDEAAKQTAVEADLEEIEGVRSQETRQALRRHERDYVTIFGGLIERADREGRATDAEHYRQMLMTFVPDYVDTYTELIADERKAGREDAARKLCEALLGLVPDWKRVGVMVQLLARDEDYYSRTLAGLALKDEYVKAFRRLYDQARRSNGDRDEREEKLDHLCKVLATYVPDFERSPEWK